MLDRTKIITCCYCGTRALLTLDTRRHELVCSGCGAPLHHIKPLVTRREVEARAPEPTHTKHKKPHKPKKQKRKKPKSMARMLGKIWDEIEDVFD